MIKSDKPDHLTEYTLKFKKYENHHRRPMIQPPRKSAVHDAKISSDTTSRMDFIAYPVTPPAKRLPNAYQPPKDHMESLTEYNNEYLGKWQVPTQPICPPRNQKEHKEPFSHSTTHATDFLAPPITPRQFYGDQHEYEPSQIPLNDMSTAHSDFVDYGKVPLTPSLKPPVSVRTRTQPMERVTAYCSTFTTPAMPEKFQRQKEIYAPPSKKVSDSTTFRSSFPKHPIVKPPKAKKPVGTCGDTSVPFESSTINRMHYKPWELPKKYSRPATTYVTPTERVSDVTTNRSDFRDFGCVSPATSSKPIMKPNAQTAPFDSLTTQNIDYRAWSGVKRPEAVRQDQEYEPPKEKFDPATTFSTDYKGAFGQRPHSAKPPERQTSNATKMEFVTSYNDTFSGPGYQACPSVSLLANNTKTSKFTFSHEDTYGHKFYKP